MSIWGSKKTRHRWCDVVYFPGMRGKREREWTYGGHAEPNSADRTAHDTTVLTPSHIYWYLSKASLKSCWPTELLHGVDVFIYRVIDTDMSTRKRDWRNKDLTKASLNDEPRWEDEDEKEKRFGRLSLGVKDSFYEACSVKCGLEGIS